jgi:predicted dienelactone hydrolase
VSNILISTIFLVLIVSGFNSSVIAKNRIDNQRPDAPVLAKYGEYKIGVRNLDVVNAKQIDIVNIDPTKQASYPRYNRPLSLEIWYPAAPTSQGNTILNVYMRDGKTKIALHGKAVRDAQPETRDGQYPLVLVSHGYPGNRFLMAHLAENIASKGYVVVSIDHTDSTYRTQGTSSSTLVNRPLDQLYVLNQIDKLSHDNTSFLHGIVDPNNTALIGYSMGGYGAVIMAGAGLTEEATENKGFAPQGLLAIHKSGSKSHAKLVDPRLKTVIAFSPWGMNYGLWDTNSLKGVSKPMLLVAGSVDDVSGYEKGIRAIWQGINNVERSLLSFDNASHSAGAPMPAPEESFVYDQAIGIYLSDHYTDPVWDSLRMNNISQHFVTAWLEKHLKQNTDINQYLQLIPHSNDGLWSKDEHKKAKADHTHWAGFKSGTAKGLRFETLSKGQ